MQLPELTGIERVMSVTQVGEVVTIMDTKKITYKRTKRVLRLIPSTEHKTEKVDRSQSSSAGDNRRRGNKC